MKIEWVICTPSHNEPSVSSLDCIVENRYYASVLQRGDTYPSKYLVRFQSHPGTSFAITPLRAGIDMVETRIG